MLYEVITRSSTHCGPQSRKASSRRPWRLLGALHLRQTRRHKQDCCSMNRSCKWSGGRSVSWNLSGAFRQCTRMPESRRATTRTALSSSFGTGGNMMWVTFGSFSASAIVACIILAYFMSWSFWKWVLKMLKPSIHEIRNAERISCAAVAQHHKVPFEFRATSPYFGRIYSETRNRICAWNNW